MADPNVPLTLSTGIRRGLRRHCPRCDAPHLFVGYLKVQSHCARCGEENGKHRVDDVASYFTVLLVGHLIVAPSLAVPIVWTAPLWATMTVLLSLVVIATLVALPFVKGGVIGALAATRAGDVARHH